jgi:hypothetical protein
MQLSVEPIQLSPHITPQTDTILAESARAAADHVRDITLINLSNAILKDK